MVLWSVYRHVCPKSCRDSTRDQCVSTHITLTLERTARRREGVLMVTLMFSVHVASQVMARVLS